MTPGSRGSQTIDLTAGQTPAPIPALQLDLGTTGINSLTVYNSSATTVGVYVGKQGPAGRPDFRVPPYTSSTLTVANAQWIYVQPTGVAAVDGEYIYLHYTDQHLVALSTPTGTQPAPYTSTSWAKQIVDMYTAPIQGESLFSQSGMSFNQGFFLTDLILRGLETQRIGWSLTASFGSALVSNVLAGAGDARISLVTPLQLFRGALSNKVVGVALILNPANNAPGVPTPVTLYAGGYYV